eukprot:4391173-Prymnesium_polylepis.3
MLSERPTVSTRVSTGWLVLACPAERVGAIDAARALAYARQFVSSEFRQSGIRGALSRSVR